MIKKKSDALKSIRKITKNVRGKDYEVFEIYFGTDPATGRKIRQCRSTEKDAAACVNEFYKGLREYGNPATGLLRQAEVYDARTAIDILAKAGVKLTLTEVTRRFMEGVVNHNSVKKVLRDAYMEYVKGIPTIQDAHLRCVKTRVGRWVHAFGADRMCSEVTAAEVEEYLDQYTVPKTWNNNAGYISSFMSWCAKSSRKYVAENPLADIGRKAIPYTEPRFMRAKDVENLMRELEKTGSKEVICYAVLTFFCGIRGAEVARLAESPDDIMLEEEAIRISMPKGWTKGVKPRMVRLPENALEWLLAYDARANLNPNIKTMVGRISRTARRIGVEYPRNVARHTFVTMHCAAYEDAAKTEAMVGTSSQMRAKNYQGLVSHKEALAFFGIMPGRV